MKTGIVIPALLREETPLRVQNFWHVFDMVKKAGYGEDLVVPFQKTPTSTNLRCHRKALYQAATFLKFETEDEEIHKSKLMNMAMEYHEKQGKEFILMIDADIHMNVKDVVERMEQLDAQKIGGVCPFQFFVRLGLRDSYLVRDGISVKVNPSDYPKTEIVDYPGAGSWGYSIQNAKACGAMDEAYTGWGWEDSEFSTRLRSQFAWLKFGGIGFHLEHENDRKINESNFETYEQTTGKTMIPWSKMVAHTKEKAVILSVGRAGSTLLTEALSQHPDVDMFRAGVEAPIEARGSTELFDQHHFSERMPTEWTNENIVTWVSESFGPNDKPVQGFKLIAGQPSPSGFKRLLEFFAHKSRYKVVLLTRDNVFEQALSFFLADFFKSWTGVYTNETMEVDPQTLAEKMEFIRDQNTMIRTALPDLHEVSYEQIELDWDLHMSEIQTFLKLVGDPVQKKGPERQRGANDWDYWVSNYDQLRGLYASLENFGV